MWNTPRTPSCESILPMIHEPKINANFKSHIKNLEKDNTTVNWKSKIHRTIKSFGEDYSIYLVDDTPKTIEEAYSSLNVDVWKEVIQSVMGLIMDNSTWELIDLPYRCKIVGYKWVFQKES